MRLSASRVLVLLAIFTSVSAGVSLPALAQQPSRGVVDKGAPPPATLQPGPYYALVIGNNNYKYLKKLQTAVNDAREVSRLLHDRYGFETKILYDATRADILTALVDYRRTLPDKSNLLIYYAGHGHNDRDADEAYWLPVDAQQDNNENWISADDITRDVRTIASQHILIISDSCYSGVLTRDADAAINPKEQRAFLAKMWSSKSRTLMASGGDEPVADGGGEGHSIFANAILQSLKTMAESEFTAAALFQRVQPTVAGRSEQLPQYSLIRNSGHNFGDFIFSRGGQPFTTPVDSPTTRNDVDLQSSGATSQALDPSLRTFVVDTDLSVMSNGIQCRLTAGDVITRLNDTPDADQTALASVSSSKPSDCAAGRTVAVKVTDLQRMHDQFAEQLNNGLSELARQNNLNFAADADAIKRVLDSYQQAYNYRDSGLLWKIWPSAPPKTKLAIENAFKSAASIKMNLQVGAPDIAQDGQTATVKGQFSELFVPRNGSAQPSRTDDIVFSFKRDSGAWVIAVVQ